MELSTAIRAVLATLRQRPSDLIPLYFLIFGVPAIARVLTFVGVAALWMYLAVTGRLGALLDLMETMDVSPPDPAATPEETIEWFEQFEPIIEILVTPTSATIVVLAIAASVILAIILAAAVEAAQLAGCVARLRQERGLIGGIRGARMHWVGFLGLYLLELLLWVVVTLVVAVLIGVVAIFSLAAAVLLGVFLLFAWLAAMILIRAVFAFAPVAIVVDNVSVLQSIRRSIGYIRGDLMGAVGYYAISIGVLIGFISFTSVVAPIGAATLAGIVGTLIVTPALHLLKTVLYGDYRGAVSPLSQPEVGMYQQTRVGFKRSVDELIQFVKGSPGLHALAFLTLLVGFIVGWVLIAPLEGVITTSIRSRLVGFIPPVKTLELFGNNWGVGISAAFSGIAFTIPAISILFSNGIVLGSVARLEVEPEVLLAFVVPHGLVEFPAAIIAGALGFQLGISAWRSWRGHQHPSELADDLERAYWVVLGLALVFAVAALIEAFISPFYWRLFL